MKRIVTALFAGALLATSPAWADRDHGHGKHWNKHAEKQWKKERKEWEKAHKHWAKHGHHHDTYVVNRYYYPAPVAEPAYVYAPPPGVQFVVRFPLN